MTPDERLDTLLRATMPELLAYFERRVEPRADAADLLAETMIVTWRKAQDLPHDDEEARRWMFGIARNLLLNAERGRRRRSRLAARLRSRLADSGEAAAADDGLAVRDAIARLDPESAELIRLVHWDGFSLTDAAALLGIPASTVRSRYQRAKASLRELLAVPSAI